jgi:secernin
MCNNVVAVGDATADGTVIFGKNSDRGPNEAHDLMYVPRTRHPKGSITRCTYVDIPQVEETNAVLLAKPSWIWGAEMAANEHGLVMGNTAVFTKEPYETGPGLIGMDFLRLAVERTKTAPEAVDLIASLLEQYGQGGNTGFIGNAYYHNSFVIADPNEAWILETSGQQWAAIKVKDVYATSNALTIEREWDRASADLIDHALERGWCKSAGDFNFKECYAGFGFYPSYLFTYFSQADRRERRLNQLLDQHHGQITVETMMALLRDHGPGLGPSWSPGPGLFENTVCMHLGYGIIRGAQTAGSMVSHVGSDVQTHFLTGVAAPCTGIFKPAWVDSGLPDIGPSPGGRYNHTSLWWRHESLHRAVIRDYATRLALYRAERDQMEARFVTEAMASRRNSLDERREFAARCFVEADRANSRWLKQVRATPVKHPAPFLYRRAWKKFNQGSDFVAGDPHRFTDLP